MFASWSGHLAIAQLLIDNNADFNLQDGNYNTALTLAIHNNHGKAALLLIAAGADSADDQTMKAAQDLLSSAAIDDKN